MSGFDVKGTLDVVLKSSAGDVKDTRHVDNLVVTTGAYLITDILFDNDDIRSAYQARPCAMAVGTTAKSGSRYWDLSSGTFIDPMKAAEIIPATVDDQRLWWEIDRCSGEYFRRVHTPILVNEGTRIATGSNEIEYTGTFIGNDSGCGYINEVAIMNNVTPMLDKVTYERVDDIETNQRISTGIMMNRATFLPVYKEPTDILTIVWTLTIQPRSDE